MLPNMKIFTFSSEFLPRSCLVKGNEVKLSTSRLTLLACTMPITTFSHSNSNSSSNINTTNTNNNKLATMWREIQGSRNWENLVNPLDSLLQEEIIRYGEFVVACYNAFDLDPNSKRYLNCKYGKNSMLSKVGLGKSGYEITKYIYATTNINVLSIGQNSSPSSSGRWIGYVAISNDEETKRLGRRDVLITFRGTVTSLEWVANLMSTLSPARLDPSDLRPEVKVEAGFLSLYTSKEGERFGLRSCREQLLSEIGRVTNMYKNEEMSITIGGHSMGSALALLLAYDIAELGLNKHATTTRRDQLYKSSVSELVSEPVSESETESESSNISVTVFSFGGPRVGNSGFKERCEELGVKVLRIVNMNDPITKLPGVLLNENFRVFGGRYEVPWSYSCYTHIGVEILLDFFNMQNPSCVHDLGTYLNLIKSRRHHHHHKSLQVQRGEHEDIFFNIAKEFFLLMLYYGEFLPLIIW